MLIIPVSRRPDWQKPPVVTLLLIAINVLIFFGLQNGAIIERFAFKAAEPTFAGLVGHMFQHGNFGHLLGNMAFLFIVGYMVEEALGKGRYLLFYLLAGIGGCCDALIGTPNALPSIGASGAISGVMAMYVCLYGMQKIRFFYWALVYFDFFRAPAIIVLPFWIAMELFQYLTNTGSNINYLAHLGGFVTGAALIGMLYLFDRKRFLLVPQHENQSSQRDTELARVEKLLNALRLEDASRELRRLAELHQDDLVIINRYYQIARHAPASDDYHHAAALIFALPGNHPATDALIFDTFSEYLKLAKPTVRFNTRLLILLIRSLVRSGHTVDAERLLRALQNRSPRQKELPDLLFLVAEAFRRDGVGNK